MACTELHGVEELQTIICTGINGLLFFRELMMPMSLGDAGRGASGRKGRTPATPWKRILGHPAVWAILVNNFTFHYAFYVVMNWLPTYFDKVGSQSDWSSAC